MVEGNFCFLALELGNFTLNHTKTASLRESGLDRFNGIDFYFAFIKASVSTVGLFFVRKRGVC